MSSTEFYVLHQIFSHIASSAKQWGSSFALSHNYKRQQENSLLVPKLESIKVGKQGVCSSFLKYFPRFPLSVWFNVSFFITHISKKVYVFCLRAMMNFVQFWAQNESKFVTLVKIRSFLAISWSFDRHQKQHLDNRIFSF